MKTLAIALSALLTPAVFAQDHSVSHDHDLSGPAPLRMLVVPTELKPDFTDTTSGKTGLTIEVKRNFNQKMRPIAGLEFDLDGVKGRTDEKGLAHFSTCTKKGDFIIQAELKTSKFAIRSSSIYRIAIKTKCGAHTVAKFNQASDGGQALGIWQVAYLAQTRLQKEVGLGFWTRQIPISWPSGGDYYFWGTVNVTRGERWDVVGHEIGHAIYAMAKIGHFGGGAHKIDQCYSEALALSEGWASYFAAWLHIPLGEKDAKFQYLVPRRAPIRIESIPKDVCKGPTNEWRVTGFFWDIIDQNNDGEDMTETFKRVWDALRNQNAPSTGKVYKILVQEGLDSKKLAQVWGNTLMTPTP